MTSAPLMIGTRPAAWLAEGLGATFVELPVLEFDGGWSTGDELDAWRTAALQANPCSDIVVAVWQETMAHSPIVHTVPDAWYSGFEAPFACWFAALTVAADRCASGGKLVAVTDRPSMRAAGGLSMPSALADAVEVTARSLIQLHSARGVGITLVATPDRTTALDEFAAGRSRRHLVEAVEMVLSSSSRTGSLTVVQVNEGVDV